MAETTVTDYVIWTKHIHGDAAVAETLASLPPGQTVGLVVAGVRGDWRKMDDGKDGRPTFGVRPLGKTQAFWRSLYRSRRGETVSLDLAERGAHRTSDFIEGVAHGVLARSDADREAAVAALLEAAGQGWRSEGRRITRDEMHER